MKEPETTKQLVIPGVPMKTVRAYEKRAEENKRKGESGSLAAELRKALIDYAAKGGGGNRTRSLGQLAAA